MDRQLIHEMLIPQHRPVQTLIQRVDDFPNEPRLSAGNILDQGKDEP